MQDFSGGKEPIAIPCINNWDSEHSPGGFVYDPSVNRQPVVVEGEGCNCQACSSCQSSNSCCCCLAAYKQSLKVDDTNKIEENAGGLIFTGKVNKTETEEEDEDGPSVIWECGPACCCLDSSDEVEQGQQQLQQLRQPSNVRPKSSCVLRGTQQGLCLNVALVKSGPKGWSVQARQMIPQGTFVCEYIGSYISNIEAQRRLKQYDAMTRRQEESVRQKVQQKHQGLQQQDQQQNEQQIKGKEREEWKRIKEADFVSPTTQRLQLEPDWNGHALLVVREVLPGGLCLRANIDASTIGNIARFFNHSCDGGNLRQVIVHRRGYLLPSVALFAKRDIYEGEEMTFAYGRPNAGPKGSEGRCLENGSLACESRKRGREKCEAVAEVWSTAIFPSRKANTSEKDLQEIPQSTLTEQHQPSYLLSTPRCFCGTIACLGFLPADNI